MQDCHFRFNWVKLVLLGWGAAATTVAAASNCAERSISWQAAYVSNWSDWQEFDTSGKRLVHESGALQGAELSAALNCGDWNFQALLSQLEGSRVYDGQTSSGTAVTSQSALHQLQGHLQTSLNITDALSLGLRLSGQTTSRDIASAGGASGYPERFDWTLLSIGSQFKTALGPGQMSLEAWAGSQLTSSMLLSLPGRDQATLQLGSIRQLELALGWRVPLSPAWSFQADARYRRTDIDQGADVVIMRNNIPVGVAHQPRTQTADLPIAIRVDYKF